jgi:hypothetical protein
MIDSSLPARRSAAGLEVLEARVALGIAARLSQGAEQPPRDVAERLRFAREQALGYVVRRAAGSLLEQGPHAQAKSGLEAFGICRVVDGGAVHGAIPLALSDFANA